MTITILLFSLLSNDYLVGHINWVTVHTIIFILITLTGESVMHPNHILYHFNLFVRSHIASDLMKQILHTVMHHEAILTGTLCLWGDN